MPKKITNDDFIVLAIKKHGHTYDYSLVKYVKSHEKVTFICKKHGKFSQTPNSHLMGRGCKLCFNETRLTAKIIPFNIVEKSFRDVHGDKYQYGDDYISGTKVMTMFCKEHGSFSLSPSKHKQGRGCQECSKQNKKCKNPKNKSLKISKALTLSYKDIVVKATKKHEGRYAYKKYDCNYVNTSSFLTIFCNIHGEYKQKAGKHLYGQGCPDCGFLLKITSRLKTFSNFASRAEKVHNSKYKYLKNNCNI